MRCMVTAIGSMSAEAVIGSIERLWPGTVTGCSMHPRSWTPASRFVRSFHQVPPATDAPNYIARIADICAKDAITHIIPLTDPEVDVLTDHGEQLADAGVVVCISPPAAIRAARDKLEIHRIFSNHRSVRPIPTSQLTSTAPPWVRSSMLAKPRRGRSSEGHVRIPDESSLAYWQEMLTGSDYVLQPLLQGDVLVVDVVRPLDGRNAVAMTRQELLRTSNGAGITVRMRPGHPCGALALDASLTLGLQGCFNMEFLEVGGTAYLMDVNPRFSAGVAFSQKAGYDMVINHLRCFLGEPIETFSTPPDAVYARGYIDHLIQDPL